MSLETFRIANICSYGIDIHPYGMPSAPELCSNPAEICYMNRFQHMRYLTSSSYVSSVIGNTNYKGRQSDITLASCRDAIHDGQRITQSGTNQV